MKFLASAACGMGASEWSLARKQLDLVYFLNAGKRRSEAAIPSEGCCASGTGVGAVAPRDLTEAGGGVRAGGTGHGGWTARLAPVPWPQWSERRVS